MAADPVSDAPGANPLLPVAPPGRGFWRPATEHWSVRLRDLLSTYLSLLLMLALAGATWWLVRVTPVPETLRPPEVSPQAPDYVLTGVELVRHRGDGSLMATLNARELRHYPVGDWLELDEARVAADHPQGAIRAQARRAVVTDQGRRIRLEGEVLFSRAAVGEQPAFEVRGDTLDLDVDQGRVWSDQTVDWRQEGSVVRAAGFDYRQDPGTLVLRGPVRAMLTPGKSLSGAPREGGGR